MSRSAGRESAPDPRQARLSRLPRMDGDDGAPAGEPRVQCLGLQRHMVYVEALVQKILHAGKEPTPAIEIMHDHVCGEREHP